MSLPATFFYGLLKSLAGQFINQGQDHAECIGEDFGSQINQNSKSFFSIYVQEEDLPSDLAAVGVLVDNKASEYEFNRTGYTFFIFVDSSSKHTEITDDLKTVFAKMVLSHETCHFVFYYELFMELGADLTSTVYTQFQSIVSGKLKNAITNEADVTSETVIEEHIYEEFLRNFWYYPNAHYDKKNRTHHDYRASNALFFNYLIKK